MIEYLGGLLILGVLTVVVVVLWAGWPVTWWVAASIALAFGAKALSKAIGESSQWLKIAKAALGPLGDACATLAIGLALAFAMQVTLTFVRTDDWVGPVESVEARILFFRRALKAILNPTWFLALLAACVFIKWRRYAAAPLVHVLHYRKWASRISGLFVVLSSFTFFSGHAQQLGDAQWVLGRRGEVAGLVSTIRVAQRELVALSFLQWRVSRFTESEKRYVASFLDAASRDAALGGQLTAKQAEELAIADTAWPLAVSTLTEPGAAEASPADEEARSRRCGDWAASLESGPRAPSPPTASEVLALRSDAARLDEGLKEERTLAIEALKMALRPFLPESADALVQPFVGALTGALIKAAGEPVFNVTIRRLGGLKERLKILNFEEHLWNDSTLGPPRRDDEASLAPGAVEFARLRATEVGATTVPEAIAAPEEVEQVPMEEDPWVKMQRQEQYDLRVQRAIQTMQEASDKERAREFFRSVQGSPNGVREESRPEVE